MIIIEANYIEGIFPYLNIMEMVFYIIAMGILNLKAYLKMINI